MSEYSRQSGAQVLQCSCLSFSPAQSIKDDMVSGSSLCGNEFFWVRCGIGVITPRKEIDNGPRCLFVFVGWINCLYSQTFQPITSMPGQVSMLFVEIPGSPATSLMRDVIA